MNGPRSILIGLCLGGLVAQAPVRGEPERDLSLLTATVAGRPSDIEAVLKKGADPNQSWGPGLTALAVALGAKDAAKAAVLRKGGAKEPDVHGQLVVALLKADLTGTQQAIQRGADPNARYLLFGCPLKMAVTRKNSSLVSLILSHKVNLNLVDETNMSPLMAASSNGSLTIVRMLLAKGADANTANQMGNTALHMAAQFGQAEVLQLLLKYRANPNAQDESGEAPLAVAVRSGHEGVIRALLAARAKPDHKNKRGETALMGAFAGPAQAAARNRIVKALVLAGADVNQRDPGAGHSPLANAVGYKDLDLMRFLIARKADVNSKDNRGCTILYWARLGNPNPEVVKLLETNGAVARCPPPE